jgi:two-component system sensor histidine kinase/response regulator
VSKIGRTREKLKTMERTSTTLLEERLQGVLSEQPITPLRLLLVTTALIFIADVFVMFVVLVLPPLIGAAEALVDGFLLATLVFPTLYFLLFRPLLNTTKIRKQAEAALIESEDRFRSLAESATDAIISADSNGTAIHWNSAAESTFGYSAKEVIGRPLVSLLPERYRHSRKNVLTRIALGTNADTVGKTIEVVGLRKDGTEFPLELSLSSWKTPEDTFCTGIVRDITKRKQTEEMLKKSIAAAEDASLAKTEFLTRMSHEIRTPVHGTIGMIDLTLDTVLSPEQHEYLSVAKSSAESLLTIINDILDFSRIGARELKLEKAPFNLRSTIELAVDMVALRAHRKGLELLCHIPPQVPADLIGDAGRLRQILVNLLGNAVKFTTLGEIAVAVEAGTGNGKEVELHFSVRDTGIGIPDDKHDTIFEAFHQADGSTTRKYGGTGLGLTISQQLVNLMGGRIWMESVPDVGSTFHFNVRLARQSPVEKTTITPAVLPDARGTRALVVDDNATSRSILRELLSNWDIEVTEAEDGLAGLYELEKARESSHIFHLIFLDKAMPGIDGFDIAGQFLDDPAFKSGIVMMLSSDSIHDDVPRCLELGISTHLVKPVKQTTLLDTVITALGKIPEVPSETTQNVDISASGPGSRILLAEDNAAAQLIARKRLENQRHEVRVAGNGFEVLQILQEGRFDLILMDVEMPGMNGLEATRVIRKMEADSGEHIPIIAMTAYAMKEDRERCLEAGMDSYISKPVNYQELYHEIESLLHSEQETASPPDESVSPQQDSVSPQQESVSPQDETASPQDEIATPQQDNASPQQEKATPPPVDLNTALDVTGGSSELLEEAVTLFLEEDYPRQLKDLKEGIEHQDAPAVKASAHGIKGAVNSFGGHAAGAIALQLQEMGRDSNFDSAETALEELEAEISRFRDFYRHPKPVSERPPTVR